MNEIVHEYLNILGLQLINDIKIIVELNKEETIIIIHELFFVLCGLFMSRVSRSGTSFEALTINSC